MEEEKDKKSTMYTLFGTNEKRDKFYSWFLNEDNRRNLRTIFTILFALIATLVYQGLRFGPTFELVFNLQTLYDFIFIAFILILILRDMVERAEYDEHKMNPEFQKLDNELESLALSVDDYIKFARQIKTNEQQRYKAESDYKRESLIQKYEVALSDALINDKKVLIKKYQKKVSELKQKDDKGQFVYQVIPENFTRYKLDDFLADTISRRSKDKTLDINFKAKNSIKRSNYTSIAIRTIFLVVLRVGLTGDFADLIDLGVFLALVIPSVITTALSAYENTIYEMKKVERVAKQKKVQLFKQILSIKLEDDEVIPAQNTTVAE